jgi:hypothetical protein
LVYFSLIDKEVPVFVDKHAGTLHVDVAKHNCVTYVIKDAWIENKRFKANYS